MKEIGAYTKQSSSIDMENNPSDSKEWEHKQFKDIDLLPMEPD